MLLSSHDLLGSCHCDNFAEQRCLVLVDSEQFSQFFGTALLGSTWRQIISLLCPVFMLSNNLVSSCPTHRQLCVLYTAYVVHKVGPYPGHIRGKWWRLQASARTRWLVRLTQLLKPLVLCHLALLWHLLRIEQCPIWCPIWISLCVIVIVDMVDSLEGKRIKVNFTKVRFNIQSISRKGCRHFSAMIQVH